LIQPTGNLKVHCRNFEKIARNITFHDKGPAMAMEYLVLVPGLNCTVELFAPQVAVLSTSRIITIADNRHDDSLVAMAKRILDAAPPRFALAGLSMGGYIAFELLRQAPERIERLMLLNTNARADNDEQRAMRARTITMVEEGEFERVNALQWPRLVHENRREDSALRAVFERMAADTGAVSYVKQQTAIMNRLDSRPLLNSIVCPVTVLVGEGDLVTPVKVAQEMANGISGANLVIVPHCGHLSTLEKPEAVAAAMQVWLA
jgi:pimeloyl-ACP methyl ester carboxylesterase